MKMSCSQDKKRISARCSNVRSTPDEGSKNAAGFTLVELTIAMVIFLIAILGVFYSFSFAINYAQALAILQQKVEKLRSARFVPTNTDLVLKGGEKSPEPYTAPDGNKFRIQVTVDDDPFTDNVQINDATKFKEVKVTVSLERPTPGWQTSVPATVILRRTRGN
jgi:prepilin-type N-terminal cleavage/methylation domain-containing protein